MVKIILSHPTGNANVRAAVKGFLDANILMEFDTCIASFPGSILNALSSLGPLAEIKRRSFVAELEPYTKSYPWKETGRLISAKAGLKALVKHEEGLLSIDSIYKSLDKKVASNLKSLKRQDLSAVYAYEDCAEASFVEGKRLGLKCFYDLPIGYWRAAKTLLSTEADRWPEWASTFIGFSDSVEKLERKDNELKLADKIFVASQFTAKTLGYYPGTLGSIEVIPYGFPPVDGSRKHSRAHGNKKLRLLFVGGLSQRKGIADLFAVADKLSTYIDLTIVGRKTTNNCLALDKELKKHKWIPSLPHNEILSLMQQHDVLVFPSLFEGFGLVITEAMAQGTPVITTDRTVGPDIIDHGHNGWIIEAGSTDALQKAIEDLLVNPDLIQDAGREALETAAKRPWEVYGKELAIAICKS
ncbi:MAG: glycosyltransferase family 4 protein [Pyrinomonadaceae bacterium]|nr:glycosyltransferase family 4 protein [Sphingobacteriaceae bacterium]